MKSQILKLIFASLLTLGLIGCGGGGGDAGSGNPRDVVDSVPVDQLEPGNIPPEMQESWEQYVSETKASSEAQILGLYDVSVEVDGLKDVGYLSIAKNENDQIIMKSFNYMNDDVDNGGACYRESKNDDINTIFNLNGGAKLNWSKPWENENNLSFYSVTVGDSGDIIKWNMDEYKNITNLEYKGITSNTSIRVRTATANIFVVKEKMYLGAVTLADIESNICNDEVIKDAENLIKNFAGIYDTTTEDMLGFTYESYLSISEDGELKAFKYMGDGYDSGSNLNCFLPSYLYNASLDSKTLRFDPQNNRLLVDVFENTYFWNLDANGSVTSVHINDGTPASSAVNHQNFISLSAVKETAITKEDIEGMFCE